MIAETGGLNAMIVDSSALLEQAVRDIMISAFQSAGQRCSALRVLYVQSDIAQALLTMLFGAMDEFNAGDPWALQTDAGPLIDRDAQAEIQAYVDMMAAKNRLLKQLEAPADGYFVGSAVLQIDSITDISKEIFGPVLHVAKFHAQELDKVVYDINTSGYGLTLGVHSRIDNRVQDIVEHARIGNIYVNRNQIGAVVGSQPFGGEGLSGTGFKAGGPHYLKRFRRRLTGLSAASGPPNAMADSPDGRPTLLAASEAVLGQSADHEKIEELAKIWCADSVVDAAWQHSRSIGPTSVELPGPTGESNRLSLHPKGLSLCLGPDAASAKAQALLSLAAGNPTVIMCNEELALPFSVPGLAVARGVNGYETIGAIPGLALVSIRGDAAGFDRIRAELAARQGTIVPLVSDLTAIESYFVERTISIDTTAAGGNASLLAEVGR